MSHLLGTPPNSRYVLNDNIYATNYNEHMIVLDSYNDVYLTLNEGPSYLLKKVLLDEVKEISADEEKILSQLEEAKIIKRTSATNGQFSFYSEQKKGATNLDWRMKYGNLNQKVPFRFFLEAYMVLCKVYFVFRSKKIYGIIELLEEQKNSIQRKDGDHNLINQIMISIDKASFYFPIRIRCLQWSAALSIILRKYGVTPVLKIGVQNYPFLAHAWVEINGKVLGDEQNLSHSLSVIYSSV